MNQDLILNVKYIARILGYDYTKHVVTDYIISFDGGKMSLL